MAILVLDIGKTNVKVALFDASARLIAAWRAPNRPLDGPPYRHHDVAAIWDFFRDRLRAAAAIAEISHIVTTTHGATVALSGDDPDHNNGLILPVLDYEDPCVEAIEPAYAAIRPPFAETLSPPLSAGLNYGRQIAWAKAAFPDAFSRTRRILAYPQYWTWRLTGRAVSEATSLGCHSDLWQPQAGRFSSLVDRLGIAALLPEIVPAHAGIGPLRADLASDAGLKTPPIVLAGIHDTNASLIPHLMAGQKPFTVVSTGTWIVVMALGIPLDRLDPQADMLANVAATGEPIACARFMGGREFAAIAGSAPAEVLRSDLERIIAGGTLALPSFSRDGGPFRHHAGRIIGPEPATSQARAALATLYSALMTDHLISRLGADSGDIVIEGGFVASAAFAEVLAALRPGQHIHAAGDSSGTAQGAAMLALWGQSIAEPHAAAVSPLVLSGLAAYAQRWREAVAALSPSLVTPSETMP